MRNILVVNINWLGDAIFSFPVFKALRKAYPQAKISCLAVPRIRDILEMCPEIDEIIIYEEKGRHRTPWGKLELIQELRKRKFDTAFLLHKSLTRALLIFLSGIPARVGYDEKGRGIFLTQKICRPEKSLHRSDHYLRVIEDYGVVVEDRHSQLQVPMQAQKDVESLLADQGITAKDFLIAVNLGGNWDLKRWPLERFKELIKRLVQMNSGKVVIPGAMGDEELARMIVGKEEKDVVVLAGKTDLKQLAALLQRADLFISADTGPLHVASGVGTNVIALFGPTRPEITGPRGGGKMVVLQKDVGCNREACYNLACPENVCMQALTVEDVLEAVRKIRN